MESGDSDSDNDSKTPEDGLSFISNKKQKNRNKSVRKESSDDDLNTSFEDFDEELIYNFAEYISFTEYLMILNACSIVFIHTCT